jgi:hypothetical protein
VTQDRVQGRLLLAVVQFVNILHLFKRSLLDSVLRKYYA